MKHHSITRSLMFLILVLILVLALPLAAGADAVPDITLGSGRIVEGSWIYFGCYNGQPVLWHVMNSENGENTKLLLAENLLSEFIVDASEDKSGQSSDPQQFCEDFSKDPEKGAFTPAEQAAIVDYTVFFHNAEGEDFTRLALNLNLDSVLLTEETDGVLRLVLAETPENLRVTISDQAIVTKTENVVSVPYYLSGLYADDRTKVFALVTDQKVTKSDASVLQFTEVLLQDNGSRTFTLENLSGTWGKDYHVYLIALNPGDASGTSDVASLPCEIKKEPPESQIPAVSSVLLPKVVTNGKTSLLLTWNRLNKAEGYDVFFAPVGKQFDGLYQTFPADINSCLFIGLKKNTAYKMRVKPFITQNNEKRYMEDSYILYCITGGSNQESTNAVEITAPQEELSVAAGDSLKIADIAAAITGQDPEKQLYDHGGLIRCVSENTDMLAVTEYGTLYGKYYGTCQIWLITPTGAAAPLTVNVVSSQETR